VDQNPSESLIFNPNKAGLDHISVSSVTEKITDISKDTFLKNAIRKIEC
jgi:hypothetical protein